VNSFSAIFEEIRHRQGLPADADQAYMHRDALYVLCETQLAISWMLTYDPENAALRVIGNYLDREMARLDVNLQNAAPACQLWMDE
jgi:hypothetical protein